MKIINETNYTLGFVFEKYCECCENISYELEDTLEPGEIQNIKDSVVIVIKEVILK